MKKQKNSKLKKIMFSIFAVVLSFCFISDGTYLICRFCLPEKIVTSTYMMSGLTFENEEGEIEELEKILEIKYYANEDNSGIKLLEFKLNTFGVENSNYVYSYGLQILGDENNNFEIEYKEFKNNARFGELKPEHYCHSIYSNSYYYNCDGDNISYDATLKFNEDNFFLVTIDNERYRLSLVEDLHFKELRDYRILIVHHYVYAVLEWETFFEKLFYTISSLPYGYDGTLNIKFLDMFKVYSYDEEKGTYTNEPMTTTDADNVKSRVYSYYNIKVNTYYTGAKTSDDSMFGLIGNDSHFNVGVNGSTKDYVRGKRIIELNQYDFDFIKSDINEEKNNYTLRLKDNVKNYLMHESNYLIQINLDSTVLLKNSVDNVEIEYDEFLTRDLVYKVVRV